MIRRLLLAATLLAGNPAAAEQVLVGPEQRLPLVELFTSHGCSSCPPADAWLRRLGERDGLWQDFVPLAFHVDYWDRLGWPDRFAAAAYTQRQADYRKADRSRAVYTPGLFVAGREWRGWFRGEEPDLSPGPRVGSLRLTVSAGETARLSLAADAKLAGEGLRAHLAVLGSGFSSPIGAGENAGRTLRENFVVLGVSASENRDSASNWRLPWPTLSVEPAGRLAVVAWLSRGADPAPLQAVAGWLQAPSD